MLYDNKRGFIFAMTILTSLIFSILVLIIFQIIDKNIIFSKSLKQDLDFDIYAKRQSAIMHLYEQKNNSWSGWSDVLTCSGGTISKSESGWVLCDSELVPWIDGVDDRCDDNNFTPTFYTGSADIYSLLSPESKIYDNDADARIYSVGFIFPWESRTVFSMNDPIKNYILKNRNNSMFALPNDVRSGVLSLDISSTTHPADFSLDSYRVDKDRFNSKKEISLLSQSHTTLSTPVTGVLDQNGDISSNWIPSVFDFWVYDYAINIANNGTGVLQYKVSISSDNQPVYIVPIDDSVWTGVVRYLINQYIQNDSSIIYRQKEISKKI